MGSVHRLNDANVAGGPIVSTSVTKIRVNGQPIATDGDTVGPDSNCDDGNVHCAPITSNGASKIRANGEPINSTGDADSCGDARKENGIKVRVFGS